MIFFCSKLVHITDLCMYRPYCLKPILIVGILKKGASITPLEEFPITPAEYGIKFK